MKAYFNETDQAIKDDMLENWSLKKRMLSDNLEEIADEDTDEVLGRELRFSEETGPLTRDLTFVVAMEAKVTELNPRRTMISLEVFQEMINFEKWLENLVYPIRPPGLPTSMQNLDLTETPLVKWSDMCKKENIDCGYMPGRDRCHTTMRPLDFIYECRINDYNLKRYKNAESLI